MAEYCEYCGQPIETGVRFCSSCGAPVPVVQSVQDSAASGQNATMVSGGGNYSVILTSLGTCARAAAADLLEDTLGYSEAESADLFQMLPAQIAQMLSRQQANYLAQAMTEYGMEVSVSNGSEYVTVDETSETQSVFDTGGSFLGKVLSVLGTISGLNRMRKFRRLEDSRLFAKPYRTQTYHPAQPVHVRRNVRGAVPQNPAPAKKIDSPVIHQPSKPGNVYGTHSQPKQHTSADNRMQGHVQNQMQGQKPGQMPGQMQRPAGRQSGQPGGGGRHEGGSREPRRH